MTEAPNDLAVNTRQAFFSRPDGQDHSGSAENVRTIREGDRRGSMGGVSCCQSLPRDQRTKCSGQVHGGDVGRIS